MASSPTPAPLSRGPRKRPRVVPIEVEIQQPQFSDPADQVLINLIFTANVFHGRIDRLLKGYGLTSQQYNILRILRGQRGKAISILDVKSRMLDRNPDVSRIVERMARKGLIARQVCPTDKRQTDLSLLPKGSELLAQIDPVIDDPAEPLARLSVGELKRLNALLNRARGGHSLNPPAEEPEVAAVATEPADEARPKQRRHKKVEVESQPDKAKPRRARAV